MDKCSTLVELLELQQTERPDRGYTFLLDGETEEARLSYAGLFLQARAIAAQLQALDLGGQRALMLYPPGLEFISGFFGCLLANVVAVPAYPPDPMRIERSLPRLQALLADAGARIILTTGAFVEMAQLVLPLAPELGELQWIATDTLDPGLAGSWRRPAVTAHDLAFLQYTSGSTGTPKGVMVSHRNLLHNLEAIQGCSERDSSSFGSSWLPMFHDMGLIGGVLQPLFSGSDVIMMSPLDFLRRPMRWLEQISKYRVHSSSGPDFAYDLCARRATEADLQTLDLSSWKVAGNGAEAVRPSTLQRFSQVFGRCGFRPETFLPCYGLAESTLFVTSATAHELPRFLYVDKTELEQHRVVPVEKEAANQQTIVSCGRTRGGQDVVIINAETRRTLGPDEVGEIWTRGDSVAQGYWGRPEESERTFRARTLEGHGPYLRTGDLGVLRGGELFVTGRLKDLIIIRGRNHYPQDIEVTAERCGARVRPGCCAAFAEDSSGEERLIIAAEIDTRKGPFDPDSIAATIRTAVAERHEIAVHTVVLLESGALPKTSSGKIQRYACRQEFLAGTLGGLVQQAPAAAVPILDRASLAGLSADERRASLVAYLHGLIARAARIDPEALRIDRPLTHVGIDSLEAVELQHTIAEALQVQFSLRALFEGASIADLAAHLETQLAHAPSAAPSSTPPGEDEERSLSRGQEALWFLQQLSPNSAAYNIATAAHVHGALDADAFRRAVVALMQRHELLRSGVIAEHGRPVFREAEWTSALLVHEDAADWSPEELHERLAHEAHRPFDLAGDVPLRVSLFTRTAERSVLLLVVHHVVADLWSMALLAAELSELYRAEVEGNAAALRTLPLSHAEYVRWERRRQEESEGDRCWRYWQRQLEHAPAALELPADRARPSAPSHRGAAQAFALSPELSLRVRRLAEREGVTSFVVLLASFQALLHRLSGQDDVLVGTPTAGRAHPEVRELVGYFANPVVLRARVSQGMTFRELLQLARGTVAEALDHAALPFPTLVERLQPVRESGRSPLFQVMFAWQQAPVHAEHLSGFVLGSPDARLGMGLLQLAPLQIEQRATQFDLTLSMREHQGRVDGAFEYSTDLFDADRIERMAGHFQTLLEGIVRAPATPLAELPLLTLAERQRVLVEWNDATREAPTQTVHALFDAQAALTPDVVAVSFEDTHLTYAQLDARSNQLAHLLRSMGVGPDVRVGLCVERSLDMVVGLLGILKAGGAYVPLDPEYPAERLAWMLEDSSVPVLVTQRRFATRLPGSTRHVLLDVPATLAESPTQSLDVLTRPEHLVYVIYTSGSTGRSKGVAMHQAPLVNLLLWQHTQSGPVAPRTAQFASISFDVSFQEICSTLCIGGRLDIVPSETRTNPEALLELLIERGVERLYLPFVALDALATAADGRELKVLRLREVITAGEQLRSSSALRSFFARLPACRLQNQYGPSETHVVTAYTLASDPAEWEVLPSIGTPIAQTQIYVLDRQLQPVPIGVPGELFVGGAMVARGYLNRPELTAERFLQDPFASRAGTRMYRTGDRARWRANGTLEFLGRDDRQVKIRGFRVEPGEIETALTRHPGVTSCAVVAREDIPGHQRLVAYVVGSASAAELSASLGAVLPEYMVPSAFVSLAALPLTPSGKVDRLALPAPTLATASVRAPSTPTEGVLANLFATVLHVESVGVDQSFFELGGHSLLGAQLVSRIRSALGVELPLRALFESPTVARLSAAVDRLSAQARPRIVPVTNDEPRAPSFAQQRLWVLDQLEPATATYNMPAAVRLRGTLDVEALRRAIEEVVRRHSGLRATFAAVNGEPVVVTQPAGAWTLSEEAVDVAALPDRLAAEARAPFDLAHGPLLRTRLLRLSEDEHVFVIAVHHIVFDGWSIALLIREVGALYSTFLKGRASPLAPLPIQYADYAAWQRTWLQGDTLQRQLDFWKQQLADLPALDVPSDKPRPPVLSHRGAIRVFSLPQELRIALEKLSRAHDATLFMTLLSAWEVLLYRYTGQADFGVGTPVAGRTHQELEELIGFFVSTLVLRADLSDDPSFVELMRRTRRVALGAYAHQDVPFDRVVEALHVARDLSRTPLFQTMFAWQNVPLARLELPGVELVPEELDSGTAKFDLTLSLRETDDGLAGSIEYATDLFEAATIDRMIGHFTTLLNGIVAEPGRRISTLPLLTELEQRQLIEWNDTTASYARERTMHSFFEEQAVRTPDAIAVEFEHERLTYSQLDQRANQLAHHLRSFGVGPDVCVALCVERSLEMVVAVFGILKAGGAYVPLDPAYPQERLSFIVEDSQAAVLVTQQAVACRMPFVATLPHVVMVDAIDALPTTRPQVSGLTSEHRAYVIYTSGSTGRPKGVETVHRNATNFLSWCANHFTVEEVAGLMASASICFDPSVFDLFFTLSHGGTVLLVRDALALATSPFADRVTLVNTVPSAATALLASKALPKSLKTMVLGGEALTEPLARAVYALPTSPRVVNSYGPTETTICSVWAEGDAASGAAPPIGRMISNMQGYVVDRKDRLLPVGIPGELLIGGEGLARGYLNRPDLTAERFIPNPFGPGRLYRSGDLVRRLPDGNLDFLGRIDHQVKIRGFRIELGEIETTLEMHADVKSCVVLAREDVPGDKRLVAYVAGAATREQLRAHLVMTLPEYMVPSLFVMMEALPLTPTGKIDRKALPAPHHGTESDLVAPRTPTEEMLAGIFAEVLNAEHVGVDQSFFELGGHSLLATQVVARVRTALGVELPLRALFESPTVTRLANALSRLSGSTLPPISPVSSCGPQPLSFAQQRLWFLDQLEPGTATYNIPAALRLRGTLDVEALRRTFEEIVRRQTGLRATFTTVNDEPVVITQPAGAWSLPVETVDATELAQGLAAEASTPFDLAHGPLLRTRLFRLSAEEHVFVLTVHHIVFDGWSVGVLIRELGALYSASPLAPLAVQYADYAAWQRSWLQGETLRRQLDFWKQQLADLPALDLPTDRPRPAMMSHRGATRSFSLPPELMASLEKLSRTHDATLFMTLLSAWQVLLHRYSGQTEFGVGAPVAGRAHRELEELVGFFVNTLVFRANFSKDPSFADLLRRTQHTALAAYAHQDVPFDRVVEAQGVDRDLSRSPLFQTMFAWQNTPQLTIHLPGVTSTVEELDTGTAKFDLTLAMSEVDGTLTGSIEYATDLFDACTVDRMIGHFTTLLHGIVAEPGRRVSTLPLLTELEQQQLVEWNETAANYPRERTMHSFFEEQAARTPDAIAVEFEHERLTYAQLDRRANQLAHHLKSLGVGPDVCVALCVERSLEMVVALFGILKAGGAYVPLDPAYPQERLSFIVEDSQATVLVTQRAVAARMPFVAAFPNVVHMDATEWSALTTTQPLVSELTSEHRAYVLYTSGSTGRPKGVEVVHRNATNFIHWCAGHFSTEEIAGYAASTSICFDTSVVDYFFVLGHGGTLLLVRDVLAIRDADRVTMINTVPSAATTLIAAKALPRSLKTILLLGEPLTDSLARALYAQPTPPRVVNGYGPTETTVFSSWAVGDRTSGQAPTIGWPIANTQMYVVDQHDELLPVGIPGDLLIGGEGLARGYLNRPETSAERFIPNLFGPGRVYRTGDLVKRLPDGDLDFIGRRDHQVKLRGFRIELGEVEATLERHPGVKSCVAVVREDVPGDRRLVAYVTGSATVEALSAHLATELPEYMVPSLFVVMEALPQTPNGKVDRKALPAPEHHRTATDPATPRTPTEEMLAGIFAEVLHIESVGVYQSFFELGGHSLLATQVVTRVRAAFGVELPLRALFESPTVARLAAALSRLSGSTLPPIVPRPGDGPQPLSFAQQRLWFLDQLEPGTATYNIPAAIRLRGTLDVEALRRVVEEIVRRQAGLRATFATHNGEPVVFTRPAGTWSLPVEDIDATELPHALAAEASSPFDLAHGPLLRTRLFRLSAEEHVFVLTVHHIVFDGWSVGVLIRELGALYSASPLAPLSVQYADYAAWQRSWLQGETLQRQLDFWKRQLAELPALDLPTDRPRPALMNHRGATRSFALPRELTASLERLSRTHDATLFMTLLSAWQVLLHRYSGQTEFGVGAPVAGRAHRELEELVGFFVNTLVFRADFSKDPSFADLLRRTQHTALAAYAHQDVPFDRVVEALGVARDMSRSPLFQTMFAWQNTPQLTIHLPGVTSNVEELDSGTSKFDLTLAMTEVDGALTGSIEYATDLFDATTVDRMIGHFTTLLHGIVAEPGRRVSTLPLLTELEQQQLVKWNETAAEYPRERTMHSFFEEQAVRTPDAIAVEFDHEHLTYAQLDQRANQLAHRLRSLGVGPDVCVGLCVERSLEMVVSVFGILKAGGAYMPLDPAYPQERLSFIVEDSRTAVLVTQQAVADRMPFVATLPHVVMVDTTDASPTTRPQVPGLTSEHRAYVIYTSGSTGRPKGVETIHRNATNFLSWCADHFTKEEVAGLMASASICFDPSVFDLFFTLGSGGTVLLVRDALALATTPFADRVTLINTVPSAASSLLASKVLPKSLKTMVLGGEALTEPLARAVYALPTSPRVVNSYGPTETTICSVWAEGDAAGGKAPPIGRMISNMRGYVVDKHNQLLPVGVPGELLIGGDGLARGYLNRDDLTVERFITNPFGPGRVYRSGDLVRRLPDGNLDFLGRIDHQVKIRGFRIELGEIETTLEKHPDVKSCVVLAREDVPGDKRLVAYVAGSATREQLRSHLAVSLPEYMVPSLFVLMDALPLTPTGKIDRKALPAPHQGVTADVIAPRTPAEVLLAGIFAEVLHVESVGVDQSFFELGGHSLLATQVVTRVRAAFGVELPLRALFESPTVARLAAALSRLSGSTLPPIAPVSSAGPQPLSFAQHRLWFLDQLEPGTATYNIPAAIRLRGALDVEALRRAIEEIVRRQPGLRATFTMLNGEPIVITQPAGVWSLPEEPVDAAELPHRLTAEASIPFDLAHGPLLRTRLFRLSGNEHVFVLTVHHIVFDGWSMGVLIRELGALYSASPLAPLSIQYADYAAWQRSWLQGETQQRQLDFWKQQLAELPALELPTDRPRPAVMSHRGAMRAFSLPRELTASLEKLSRAHDATLFMTLLSAWQVLLHRYSGQSDFGVGAPVAGRPHRELEELVGFFVNTLVFRASIAEGSSFADVLKSTQHTALAAYAHQDVPFDRVVEAQGVDRDLSRSPLFQTMFAWQNTPLSRIELPGVTSTVEELDTGTAKFDLTLAMSEVDGTLTGSIEYATDLFDACTVDRMIGHFTTLLHGIVAEPGCRVSHLPLLAELEQQQLVKWNETAAEYPRERTMHSFFEEQAARTPDAIAVEFDHEHLTYAQLDQRANQLAHRLRSLGVGPDVCVGLCVERSLEMVVSVFGILKAGGAYVPLDPAYPQERLSFIVEDSQATVLVTQQAVADRMPFVATLPHVVMVDTTDALPTTRPQVPGLTSEHRAYVIYTSGSTGRPKGVETIHRNATNFLSWCTDHFTADEVAGLMASASICFDPSVFDLFFTLGCGGTVLLVRDALALATAPFADRVTLINTVPSAATALLESKSLPKSLKTMVLGGEALTEPLARSLYALPNPPRIVNSYGPTETTICSVWAEGDAASGRAPPIGRMISNMEGYVVDKHNQLLPVGVPGELLIGGEGLARGYLNRSDLTAERFIPNPFGPGRVYRSGDLVRRLRDGNLDFLGRIDHQVKIRGFRIELGEIETTLEKHSGVKSCVVLAREDVPGDKRLVAYVAGSATREQLRSHLALTLPEYMVPSIFVMLDALPLTPTGKIDRKALPRPDQATSSEEKTAPRTPLELQLVLLWEELLGVHPVGVHDNFFALGGHSLLAVRLAARVQERLGVSLPLVALFQAATVQTLAVAIESAGSLGEPSPLVVLGGEELLPPLFLIHSGWGHVVPYLELAEYLKAERRIYGIQARGIHPGETPRADVAEMAREYLALIRRTHPTGPYCLGGWSFGGLVAYEMAQQLRLGGEHVSDVILLDAFAPREGAVSDVGAGLANVAQMMGLPIDAHELFPLSEEAGLNRLTELAERTSQFPVGGATAYVHRQWAVSATHERAAYRYRPEPYAGSVTLVQTEESKAKGDDSPESAWRRLVSGPFQVLDVAGGHDSMVKRPQVDEVARLLLGHLRAADEG